MIKLKNGTEINFNEDFETFFQNLIKGIIDESVNAIENDNINNLKDINFENNILKEIMDNSILVSSQILDIEKINKNLSKFLITGFLFNSIVLSIPNLKEDILKGKSINDKKTIH